MRREAGAQGYLLKEIAGEAVLRAVRMVAGGETAFDLNARRVLLAHARWLSKNEPRDTRSVAARSEQDRRVLVLVSEGKTNKQIADALGLSPKTVKNYLTNIFDKLRVRRRSHAAALYSKRSY